MREPPDAVIHAGDELGELEIRWVNPDIGSFGREQRVVRAIATHARVSGVGRDGEAIDLLIPSLEADLLIRRAETGAFPGLGDLRAATEAPQNFERPDPHVAPAGERLTCPLCGGQEFRRERGGTGRWGFGPRRVRAVTCLRCKHMLHFAEGHTIYDLD